MILYLAWRQPDLRWWPVGRLSRPHAEFVFQYTRGALSARSAGFRPLLSFPDVDQVYASSKLFPLFANRLMPESRPEYPRFVEWLDLPSGERDPLVLLARSGGRRETDTFEVFPEPERTPGPAFQTTFFVHGLRHRPEAAASEALQLASRSEVCLQPDPGNPVDPTALKVITSRGTHIGFVPRYLCRDLQFLRGSVPVQAKALVRRVNLPPTPMQFRVLCTFEAPWPDGFRPFADPDFAPIRSAAVAAVA